MRCRYAEAATALRTHIALVAGSEQAQDLLARATERQKQQEQGQYDMDALREASAGVGAGASGQPGAPAYRHLDCAEYVHGAVTVVDMPGKGRGLVTTQALKAGQLVMAVRAEQVSCTVSAWPCSRLLYTTYPRKDGPLPGAQ